MSADMPGTRRLSYKFRIYPTEAQKEAIQANIDACRYIYNRLLRMRIDSYQATKPTLKEHVLAPGADPESERPEWLRGADGEWVYEEVANPGYDPEAKPLTKFDCSKLVRVIKTQAVSEDGRFFLKEADSSALVPATTATAQTCSACGRVEKAVADDLKPRWRCPECGTVHDRKGNGAQNVLEEGMRLLAEAKE